jgi:hypothetical protein
MTLYGVWFAKMKLPMRADFSTTAFIRSSQQSLFRQIATLSYGHSNALQPLSLFLSLSLSFSFSLSLILSQCISLSFLLILSHSLYTYIYVPLSLNLSVTVSFFSPFSLSPPPLSTSIHSDSFSVTPSLYWSSKPQSLISG